MKGYEVIRKSSEDRIRFYFISSGKRRIIKVVDFVRLKEFEDLEVYNLGFGDYNVDTNLMEDQLYTDNGDERKVFNTVLNTILIFFQHYPLKMLIIRGSDSKEEFKEKCRITCTKNCGNACRKFNQRIRIYRNYLNKNFGDLSLKFEFFGGLISDSGQIFKEPYIPGKEYDSVLLKKI
jgi:hypothetical protein